MAVVDLSGSDGSSNEEKSVTILESAGRPNGIKKGKLAVGLKESVNHLSKKMEENQKKGAAATESAVERMLAELKESSESNFL